MTVDWFCRNQVASSAGFAVQVHSSQRDKRHHNAGLLSVLVPRKAHGAVSMTPTPAGSSAIRASLLSRSVAILEAFSKADRTTFIGSITPTTTMPSFVTVGVPDSFASRTVRPRGSSVLPTAFVSMPTPRRIASRASCPNSSAFTNQSPFCIRNISSLIASVVLVPVRYPIPALLHRLCPEAAWETIGR